MKRTLAIWVVSLVLVASLPAFAHHSFSTEFDANKPISLKGTVTKLEFSNPHIWLYIDVKDADGKVTHWTCEGGAPNALFRLGWSKDSVIQNP